MHLWNTSENRKSLINDKKLQNECLKTNRLSGFTSQKCVQHNSAHQKDYWAFLTSMCPKIITVTHGMEGKISEIDVRKPIDLVV